MREYWYERTWHRYGHNWSLAVSWRIGIGLLAQHYLGTGSVEIIAVLGVCAIEYRHWRNP